MQRDVLIYRRHKATCCWMGMFIRQMEAVHIASPDTDQEQNDDSMGLAKPSVLAQRRKTFKTGVSYRFLPGNRFQALSGFRCGLKRSPFTSTCCFSILGECALALESHATRKKKGKKPPSLQRTNSSIQTLRSISHDLGTPLTSISGNAGYAAAHSAITCWMNKRGNRFLRTF